MSTRCPYCFFLLTGSARVVRCRNPACADQVDLAASAFAGMQVRAKALTTVPATPSGTAGPASVPCAVCRVPADIDSCPRCHLPLPLGWRQVSTTCIAMAGARASGKSVYIAVLKRQAELLAEQLGGALGYADSKTRTMYEEKYEKPLFVQRGLLPMTASLYAGGEALMPQRDPLVFTLGTIGGGQHVLVVRDVAGEDLEKVPGRAEPFVFFSGADAVFFLFDPLRVESVSQQLLGVVPASRSGADPLVVLDNLVGIMRGTTRLGTDRLDVPLAVVMAKFDSLQLLSRVHGSALAPVMANLGAAFNRDPSLDGPGYDEADGALLDAEIASLLSRLGARALLNRVDSVFPSRRYFAVSALGGPPATEERLGPRGIAPFRCLDPLKWAMRHSGLLAAA